MKRLNMTCYALMVSAVVMATLMMSRSGLMDREARAEMVVNKNNLTTLTTEFRRDEEALYVLDSQTAKLLVYVFDPNKKANELMAVLDVAETINAALGKTGKEGGRSR